MIDPAATDHRITEVEAKLAFAEDLIDALNKTVFRQQEQLDLLQAQLRVLHRQLRDALPAEDRNLRDEIPPHY
ncbi:MAG: SlyX family protein [Thiobacillus sp.]